jgi:hypothetical protein
MGDPAPGEKTLGAQETAKEEPNGEPEPEPQATLAPPAPGDLAKENAPESKFHG